MSNTHKIQIPQLAAKALRDVLEAPGWATLTSDHGVACKLLDSVIPELKQPDEVKRARSQSEAREVDTKWCDTAVEFEVTDAQRDKVRKALKHLLERAALPPGRYTYALLTQFGLANDE